MAKRTFNIRVDEQFFEDLKLIQDAQDFEPTQTEVVSALVSKEAAKHRKRKRRKLPEIRRIAEADDGALEGDL